MGKPLISDAQMIAMHASMLQLHQAAPTRSAAAESAAWPIALLAATLLQLRSEDLLITAGHVPLAITALRGAQQSSFHPDLLPFSLACDPACAASVATGYALAQSHSTRPGDHAPLTLAMLSTSAGLSMALDLAGEHALPLLVLVRDEPGKPRPTLAAPANVEVIAVDAEDAVAVCRVMQESTLRARNRWGSVVLRATTLPGSADPIIALESHLERRGLKPAVAVAENR